MSRPRSLDDVGREARDAGVVGGLLAGLAHDRVDLGPCLGDDLLDAAGMDPAVGDELGDGDPGDLAADRVEARQDDGLRRVVDDQVDAGGLFEGPDVAALAADDPALHLVRRQVDDRDRVLGRVVGGDALDRGDDDVAGLVLGILAGAPLDGPGDLDRVVLGFLADRLDQDALGVVRGHVRDPLEGDDLFAMGAGQFLAGLVELALPFQELAIALLEHVGALVELVVAGEETRSRVDSSARRARASSSASRCIFSFSSLASRINSFWRARASASMRRASDVAAFIVWDAQRLRRKKPATAPPTAATTATARMSRGSIIRFLPSDRSRAGRA